jgi:hypothetical protein
VELEEDPLKTITPAHETPDKSDTSEPNADPDTDIEEVPGGLGPICENPKCGKRIPEYFVNLGRKRHLECY